MSAFQGFDIKLNLRENTQDRDVLNNLGGAPIADDIELFINNLRNTSELLVDFPQRNGFDIEFNPNVQRFVFTNGTQISIFVGNVKEGDYFVGNSNAVNRFRIYQDENLTQPVFPIAGANVRYVRSDAVESRNILNLNRARDPVVENISSSQIGDVGANFTVNPYTSYIRVYNTIRSGFSSGISGLLNSIENGIDIFAQKRDNSITNIRNFATNNGITLSGSLIISDPNQENAIAVRSDSGPGIFILNPETDQGIRAFSSNENAWTADGNDLVVASKEASVGNFVFDNGVRILRKNGAPNIATETAAASSFTHFVAIKVNGEEYSLCLK